MKFYKKYILPRFLNLTMKNTNNNKERSIVATQAIGTVLEIGFGSGLNIPFYKNVNKLYALDPSAELFALAKERIHSATFPVEYLQAGAEKIPLADNSVDTAISTWNLCSIPSPELALKEIKRVLKPEGKFIFIEHGKSPKNIVNLWQNWLTPFSKCLAGGCYLNRNVEKLISDAGFDIVSLEKYSQTPKILNFMYRGVVIIKK